MMMHRIALLLGTWLCAAALPVSTALAQAAFPSQRIEIVIPLTPGSAPDILARLVGERLSQRLGQPVIVSAKPGAATQLAMAYLKRAKPDGHTLLLIHSGMIATSFVYKAYTGDILKDHTFISAISTTPYVVAVNSSLPVQSIADLIAYSKANPQKLNFGSTGGAYDIDAIRLQKALGIQVQIIPYPGGSQQLASLAANETQVSIVSVRSARPLIKNIRLLAVASPKRFTQAPELPTLDELGIPQFYGGYWYGLIGPADMPAAVTQRLNREINEILAEPEVLKRIEGLTNEVLRGSPADFENLARQTYESYKKTALDAGIKPE
ncbi:MAG: tripartite tricarboxylate transporter substrate binding protein [Burkholderiaceae bacterium]|nr:tripartite tricarboxylate transporter substrate binding protein [Burkholderiaceae bacterium]MDO9089170.1 tripartite tricarboxylate transporter substrate binding protein [Burkholderiaceae bacterium]